MNGYLQAREKKGITAMDNEKNAKKLRKPNVIDFLIIILIIGCVAGVAIRYDIVSKLGVNSNNVTAEVSFLIEGIRDTSVEALVVDDEFFWAQNEMPLGTLKSREASPAVVYVVKNDLEIVEATNEQRYDVRGTLQATGVMTADGFMLGGTQYIGAGKQMNVKSKNISVTMTITDVRVINE